MTLAWGGYYTAVMDAGVHVVALQTNFYDDANLFLKWGVGHWDMSGQLHWMESVLEQIICKRLGEPSEVAPAICFLLSDAASYINGATLHINGGGLRL